MNPIITNISNPSGEIKIAIHRFKTVYTFKGSEYNNYRTLAEAVKSSSESFDKDLKTNILKLERATLLRHYENASRPMTIDNMLVDLSDRGVESNMIIVPCLNEECTCTKIEEVEAPMRLDEIATQAEYASEFTDGLCLGCYEQEQMEQAEEEVARAREEAREDLYNVSA